MSQRPPTYQVNFRITAEDRPLLDAARAQFGTYQAGILAGLQALARQRLDDAPPVPAPILLTDGLPPAAPPAPAPTPPSPPPSQEEGNWWLPVELASSFVGASGDTVRRWAAESGETRRGAEGLEVELESLEVPRHVAARLLHVKSPTLAERAKSGREPQPLANGLYRIGDLHFTVTEAARHKRITPTKLHELLDSGELASHAGEDGQPRIPVIDFAAHE